MKKETRRIACVYAITNTINGKRYIGSTADFECRCQTHKRFLRLGRHYNAHLQRAWNKYGASVFLFGIVSVVSNPDEIIESEQSWIDGFSPEYNICPKARSCAGVVRSAATRKKISESHKSRTERSSFWGKKHSLEAKIIMRAKKLGKKLSLEHRLKLSLAQKKRWTPIRRDERRVQTANRRRKPNGQLI